MNLSLRAVEIEDLEALTPLDAAYAMRTGVPSQLSRGALAFYARSGHAFVAEQGGRAMGFVLAQAVWSGERPVVQLARLVAEGDALPALAEAVVKSAYDAGVYDLSAELPPSDHDAADVLLAKLWQERPVRRFDRVLGSRGPVQP